MLDKDVALQFRMHEETHYKLKYIAKRELRSLNSQIEYFALKGIAEYEREHGEIIIEEE